MSRVAELRARREALLARSTGLRRQLVAHGTDLEHSMGRIDRGIRMARSLRAKPIVLAVGAAVLFALGPRRALGWVSRAMFFASLARRATGLIAASRNSRRHRTDDHHQLFI